MQVSPPQPLGPHLASQDADFPHFGEPAPVSALASIHVTKTGAVRLSVATDLALDGTRCSSWLVVTQRAVFVVRKDEIEQRFDLTEVTGVYNDARVGSGMLQLELGEAFVDVLRYDNRHAHRFRKAATKIKKLLESEGATVKLSRSDLIDPHRCENCGFRLPSAGEACVRCISRGNVLRRVLAMVRPYRQQATSMMVLLLIGVALDLVSPQLTRFLVDHVLPGGPLENATAKDPVIHAQLLEALVLVVGVLAVVQVARMMLNMLNGRIASSVGSSLTYDVRNRLVRHMQGLGIEYYERQQIGALVGRVAYDTEAVHDLIWQMTGGFILQLIMVVGVFAMMMTIDPELALLALLPSPLVMGATIFFWRKIYPRYYRFWEAGAKQAGALTGMLRGVRVVKFFGQEDREAERFEKYSKRYSNYRKSVDGSIAVFNGGVGILFQIGGWFVWYFGGSQVLDGRLSLGELMAFFGYLWMFYGPLAALPQLTTWLTQFATQSHRIFELLDTPVTLPQPTEPVHPVAVRGAIEFDNVTFSYEGHHPAVRGISLSIAPGETIGIVGGSGSGKSTLINLLCRLYDVEEGCIRIDGIDIRQLDKSEHRRTIGVVPQETVLFGETVADNIAYGVPNASPGAILRAAKAAQCHDFVLGHSLAYDTVLGENGAGLSGGERQRVGIARALLTDPPILVLDEATSNVDPRSEAAIQAGIDRITEHKTTIAIAHRMSALRAADRIVVIDEGRVAEVGTPTELLELGGKYAEMVKLQGGEIHKLPEREDDGSTTTRRLRPENTHLLQGKHGVLEVEIDGERHTNIIVIDCFPISRPRQYLSIRRRKDEEHTQELGIIDDPSSWPAEEREHLEQALRLRYLWHEIQRVQSVELVNDLLTMRVQTQLGQVDLTVRRGPQWALDFGNEKLIVDVDDNHYVLPLDERLKPEDRLMLSRYVDL